MKQIELKKMLEELQKEIDLHSDKACFFPDDALVYPAEKLLKLLGEIEQKFQRK